MQRKHDSNKLFLFQEGALFDSDRCAEEQGGQAVLRETQTAT